jgi:hypothetical protein
MEKPDQDQKRDTRLQSKKIKLEAAKLGLLGSTEIITPEIPPLPLKDAWSYCCCTRI